MTLPCPNCQHKPMFYFGHGEDNEPYGFGCPVCHLFFWPDQDVRDEDCIYGSFSLYLADYGRVWVSAWLPVPDAPACPAQPGTRDYWPAGWFGWAWEFHYE